MDQIRVVFFGTGAGTPSRERNVPSLAVALGGRVLLFDCGEGTQHQTTHGVRGYLDAVREASHFHPRYEIAVVTEEREVSWCSRMWQWYIQLPGRSSGIHAIRIVGAALLEHTVDCFGYCVIEGGPAG